MKGSIGDFAERLIQESVGNIKSGKELPPSAHKKAGLAPAGKDISKVKVPDSFMKQILEEQYTPQESEPVDSIPELVWTGNEPKQEPKLMTEETAQELVPLLQQVIELLQEMTTTGSIGVNLAGPQKGKNVPFEKIETKYGYKSYTST
jgi:HEPN domain-containing protein